MAKRAKRKRATERRASKKRPTKRRSKRKTAPKRRPTKRRSKKKVKQQVKQRGAKRRGAKKPNKRAPKKQKVVDERKVAEEPSLEQRFEEAWVKEIYEEAWWLTTYRINELRHDWNSDDYGFTKGYKKDQQKLEPIEPERIFIAGSFPAYVLGRKSFPNLNYRDIDIWHEEWQSFGGNPKADKERNGRRAGPENNWGQLFGGRLKQTTDHSGKDCQLREKVEIMLHAVGLQKNEFPEILTQVIGGYLDAKYNIICVEGLLNLQSLVDGFDINAVMAGVEIQKQNGELRVANVHVSPAFRQFLKTGTLSVANAHDHLLEFDRNPVQKIIRLCGKAARMDMPFTFSGLDLLAGGFGQKMKKEFDFIQEHPRTKARFQGFKAVQAPMENGYGTGYRIVQEDFTGAPKAIRLSTYPGEEGLQPPGEEKGWRRNEESIIEIAKSHGVPATHLGWPRAQNLVNGLHTRAWKENGGWEAEGGPYKLKKAQEEEKSS